jgi:hypothetical protein
MLVLTSRNTVGFSKLAAIVLRPTSALRFSRSDREQPAPPSGDRLVDQIAVAR